ncbi:MAG: helix-turn-helix domain-containing protein [Thiolinea sp.]
MPDEKKATPTAAHETQHHHNNLDKPYKPKSQRERRVLAALVNGSVIRHDLDTIVGTDNAPEYVSRLRLAGWDISTERIPVIDRDGLKVRVGRYCLSRAHRALAQTILGGLA